MHGKIQGLWEIFFPSNCLFSWRKQLERANTEKPDFSPIECYGMTESPIRINMVQSVIESD